MQKLKFTVLSGDGIGPEVMTEALKILDKVAKKGNFNLDFDERLVGGAALDAVDHPLPEETLKACESSDAILFGSVGGPKWESLPAEKQPERGALLPLRKHFGLFANLRPSVCYKALAHASPLKNEIVGDGFDVLCVRELTGGIYFGSPKKISDSDNPLSKPNGRMALDTMVYHEFEIERIAELAFEMAMKRSKKVCSIDKANVLQNGVLWREVVARIGKNYSEVELENLYVDNAAMQLLRRPRDFDVILAPNLFGDILSDEMAMVAGSLGILASASLGQQRDDKTYFGMYEPSGGSAPDIAGQGIANPIAQILSAGMMLNFSFNLKKEADIIENAVSKALNEGYRTGDIFTNESGLKKVGTSEMGDAICKFI